MMVLSHHITEWLNWGIALWGFSGGAVVKNLLPLQEMWKTCVQSLGQKDPMEEEVATHSSILAQKVSWTVESDGLQFMEL